MPFYRMDIGGTVAWVHMQFTRRTQAPAPCVAWDSELGARCGRVSVALCDHPAGTAPNGRALTCDAPICAKHRTATGRNRDLCPRHVRQVALPL